MGTKRICLLSLALLFFLLCGCGAKQEAAAWSRAEMLRAAWLSTGSYTGTAHCTANYQTEVFPFALTFVWTPPGSLHMSLTEPESVAGISATFDREDCALSYDDLRLGLDSLGGDALSPLGGMARLFAALGEGHLKQCSRTNEDGRACLRLLAGEPALPPGRGTEYVLLVSESDGVLLSGEMRSEGETQLLCRIEGFAPQTGADAAQG